MTIRYECDMCGVKLAVESPARYIVKLEVFAAAGPIDLDKEASIDPHRELKNLIEKLQKADPDQIEDRTYRAFRFDVCDSCRAALISNPLRV